MDQPINLDNLRQITGGDPEVEAELFRMFFDSSGECVAGLHKACAAGNEDAWRERAHALKGISFNLGAELLGALCKKAQDDCRAEPGEKQRMLAQMEAELERVRDALKKLM